MRRALVADDSSRSVQSSEGKFSKTEHLGTDFTDPEARNLH